MKVDFCRTNLGCDIMKSSQKWSHQVWTTAFEQLNRCVSVGEVNAPPPVERLPYHDKECCVMAWATPDFYYCNSGRERGREKPSTGEDELDDWQDEWRAATVCTLSLRFFNPSPDARRPLCLSPSPPIIRISVMTARQRGLRAAPVCLTRVPLTLLCFFLLLQTQLNRRGAFYLWKSSVWSSFTCSTIETTSAWLHVLSFFCLYCLLQLTDWYCFRGNQSCTKAYSDTYSLGKGDYFLHNDLK